MRLVVDIGNTRSKAAVFKDSSLLEHFIFADAGLRSGLPKVFEKYPQIADVIVASVANDRFDFVFPDGISLHVIDQSWNFPFGNLYETPLTLGIDRMVLAAGAVMAFPAKNRLVIDAGTCITYDYINDRDQYCGGAISPGIRLRYESLHNFTAKLPLLKAEIPTNAIGRSTAGSIHSGVVNGVVNEIDGFIDLYRGGAENFIIILTGGDTEFLAGQLKNTIFANQNFLLESLNQTYIQNKHD